MNKITHQTTQRLQIHGNGLFSKDEVTVSINKAPANTGIVFILNGKEIPALVDNVTNSNRNIVLTKEEESICLVEHFLATCSLLGINDIKVTTNKNELIFNDGSAEHWQKAFLKLDFCNKVIEKYELKNSIFLKSQDKEIVAIPHSGFKVSYFMDWQHPLLGKKFVSWVPCDGVEILLKARTFATKEENDYFGMSESLLTLTEEGFNKKLNHPLEPLYHKILDMIGDLRLCGINPLEINMHVIGFKSGHELNVEMAKHVRATLAVAQ
ncbi:MAG: UDP-3-O-acyl-N-acetylglucosamine deacetylase [Candidatus Melainabacteria bacterium]|nr:UDP-3-O-acyl-N-acetylglucosamine deacetylase [Candidatus Melainabacteria bacterium]